MTSVTRALLMAAALALGVGNGVAVAAASPTDPPEIVVPLDSPTPTAEPTTADAPAPTPSHTAKAGHTSKDGQDKAGATPKATPMKANPMRAAPTPGAGPVPRPGQVVTDTPAPDQTPQPEATAPPEKAVMAGDDILKTGMISADDAEAQATLVDVEDQRIVETRAALTALMQTGGVAAAQRKQPQVFSSVHGRTLVLPARNTGAPYTLKDLMAVEKGRYLRRMKDGSYLLGVHVFVADGATLQLRAPLTLRMGSLPGSFSSIVAFGGNIEIKGTANDPVRISSWDVRTEKPDETVADGRAYIRAVGGVFEMAYAHVDHLGFWSGRTGGIALTGTERPASAYRHRNKAQRHQDKRERMANAGSEKGGSNFGDVETIPIGPGTASHVLADELVSGSIEHSVITGNAYGLFVSGSNQTRIVDDEIVGSLVHGVFMHRFAKNAKIEGTKVIGSGGDGFVLSRATEKVRITDCLAERNGRNGFTLNGRALADGPSASGESLAVYGDSSVNNSVARDNARYGIEVLGGSRLAVQTSEVIGGDMGIVVREGASGVQISGNKLRGQRRQAIALRDGATGAQVAGNTISDALTGIYLRGSNGKIIGNTIRTAPMPKAHGITLVGDDGASEIARNTIVGAGTSAISSARAHGDLNLHNNDDHLWHDTSSFWVKAKRYVKPMNLIWAGVILLVIVSALRSRGAGDRPRRRTRIHNPYERQRVLAERPVTVLRHAAAAAGNPAHSRAHAVHRSPSFPLHANSAPTAEAAG
ncbi:right-handed parallel beta-helix repeat-containing protein [Planotetraspora sp. GP83]|uniref:right-handed parallel beta-helix repeat-containing protein n=1 Tax=Planotetraspora sp. GP83 TaxID=3156264 RepID=UPI003513823B